MLPGMEGGRGKQWGREEIARTIEKYEGASQGGYSHRKMAALTTTYNFFIQREDHTTAAERFFAAKPRDLFAWVLDHVDLPGRPAQQRPGPPFNRYLLTGVT